MSRYEKKPDMYDNTANGAAEATVASLDAVGYIVRYFIVVTYKFFYQRSVLAGFLVFILFFLGWQFRSVLEGLIFVIAHPVEFIEYAFLTFPPIWVSSVENLLPAHAAGNNPFLTVMFIFSRISTGSYIFIAQIAMLVVFTRLVIRDKRKFGDFPPPFLTLQNSIVIQTVIEGVNGYGGQMEKDGFREPKEKFIHYFIEDTVKRIKKKNREVIFKEVIDHCLVSNKSEMQKEILKQLNERKICKKLVASYR